MIDYFLSFFLSFFIYYPRPHPHPQFTQPSTCTHLLTPRPTTHSHALTVSASMPVHPLDLPEVLAAVGVFLLLWEQDYDPLHYRSTPRFNPATLRACVMVSKLWRQILLPILWTTYDHRVIKDAPSKELITRLFRPHFRIVRAIGSTTVLLDGCTQLVELPIEEYITSSFNPMKSIDHHPSRLLSEQTRDSESWIGMVGRGKCCLISRMLMD